MIVRLTLAYDGTGFRGWARQRGLRTVEGVLTDALSRFLGAEPRISVAGRTDAGVHARGQVASFAWPEPLDLERVQRALNGMLAPEVVVLEARRAPEGFDARFSASAREYRYRIDVGPWPDPFEARFVWHRPGELSVPRMRAAARPLVGEHDFASFGRPHNLGGSTVRRVERLAVARRASRLELSVRANAFLHQMVRSLVGTLVAAGEGRIEPQETAAILAAHDRGRSKGRLAPPHGLTLERVVYGRR
ncbi:MAG TPA: tRNA pseudouridine(38-40) synthase TruA [Actinomycetota bacterium]|nr:tRNA pseudouridine(38-40) synthase TruA [Actinomycetota bacterium]